MLSVSLSALQLATLSASATHLPALCTPLSSFRFLGTSHYTILLILCSDFNIILLDPCLLCHVSPRTRAGRVVRATPVARTPLLRVLAYPLRQPVTADILLFRFDASFSLPLLTLHSCHEIKG